MLSLSPSSGGVSPPRWVWAWPSPCGIMSWGLYLGGVLRIDSKSGFTFVFLAGGCHGKGENLSPAPGCRPAVGSVLGRVSLSQRAGLGDFQMAAPSNPYAGPSILHRGHSPGPLSLGAGRPWPCRLLGFPLHFSHMTSPFLESTKKSVDLRNKWKILFEPN